MFKSDLIFKELYDAITTGLYGSSGKLPSGKELASQYKVTHLTMRRVLKKLEEKKIITQIHGRGTFVLDLQPIKRALILLDYVNDAHALFPLPLQQVLFKAGCIAVFFDVRQIHHNMRFVQTMIRENCDLLFFDLCNDFPLQVLDDVPERVVKINFNRGGFLDFPFAYSQFLCDSEADGRIGMEALLQAGATRPAIYIGDFAPNGAWNRRFLHGARQLLNEHGLQVRTVYCEDKLTEAQWDQFFSECDSCLALLDSYLPQFCAAAESRNIIIPEQCKLVGRNNTPWAKSYNLTSIDPQVEQVIATLETFLKNPHQTPIKHITKPTVQWRNSCPER